MSAKNSGRREAICRSGSAWRMFYLLLFILVAAPVYAHDSHSLTTSTEEANLVSISVPDLELTNQRGEKGLLVSDFIGQRMVAFTFVYTTCTTICPVIDGIFRNLQSRIEPELGDEFALLTLTIDSAIDIPARLKEHTAKLGVMPGWNYLTGDRDVVNGILRALEVYTPDIANHPPVVFIVNGRKGEWYRLNGFSSPELLERTMRQKFASN